VHDLGETAGEIYLSMEYVDGENLDALLRRIGRFPREKSLDTTRQICAGLGAAHDKGVLHRDLKLQNVMFDGEGRVRITDFGIAALATDPGVPLAGTPAYMAPELWRGVAPSARSDLYSLGVVLYELATGQSPFPGESSTRNQDATPPVNPSLLVPEVDPAFERIILQCLQFDPARRPRSAYAVAAALPGGGVWADLIAAGGTPSPEMIAAASPQTTYSSRWLVGLLTAILIGLAIIMVLADRTLLLTQAAPQKPPAVLADRAQQIMQALGHGAIRPSSWGFEADPEFIESIVFSGADPALSSIGKATPRPYAPAVNFWYREGDLRLPGPIPLGETSLVRPQPVGAGSILVKLDTNGALREFIAKQASDESTASSTDPPEWLALFQLAALNLSDFHTVEPRSPPVFADHLMAWESQSSKESESLIRVDGATQNGRVVYFQIRFSWERRNAADLNVIPSSPAVSRTFAVRFFLNLGFLAVALGLAWNNACSGRGDRQGAGRLALFITGLAMLEWLLGKRHAPLLAEEATSLFLWTARATLVGSALWVSYLAVEPYVRRYWPESIVSWSRILTGQWNDGLVRRDVLFGAAFGVAIVLLQQFDALLPELLGRSWAATVLPIEGSHLDDLLGLRFKLGAVMNALIRSISTAFLLLLAMLVFRVTIRNSRVSAVAYGLFLTVLIWFLSDCGYLTWLTAALFAAGIVALLTRVGLTALIAGLVVRTLLLSGPMTVHWDAWYAPAGNLSLVLVATLAVWAAFDGLSRLVSVTGTD
jgi:serine/threonine-protein kinase